VAKQSGAGCEEPGRPFELHVQVDLNKNDYVVPEVMNLNRQLRTKHAADIRGRVETSSPATRGRIHYQQDHSLSSNYFVLPDQTVPSVNRLLNVIARKSIPTNSAFQSYLSFLEVWDRNHSRQGNKELHLVENINHPIGDH
jgi:hypothetical protein